MELRQRTQETDHRSSRPRPNLRQFEHKKKKKDGVVAKNSGEGSMGTESGEEGGPGDGRW